MMVDYRHAKALEQSPSCEKGGPFWKTTVYAMLFEGPSPLKVPQLGYLKASEAIGPAESTAKGTELML